MKRISSLIFLALAFLFIIPVFAPRVPTTTSIPPIPAQSAGVQLQCSPPQAFPGSVTPGSSGFIRIRCPDKNGFILFGQQGVASTTLTPSLVLGLGYINASIMLFNNLPGQCNFNYRTIPVGNFTVANEAFFNHGSITFGNPPTNSSEMLAGNYDYCLQYQNAPSTGLAGFDIVWT